MRPIGQFEGNFVILFFEPRLPGIGGLNSIDNQYDTINDRFRAWRCFF